VWDARSGWLPLIANEILFHRKQQNRGWGPKLSKPITYPLNPINLAQTQFVSTWRNIPSMNQGEGCVECRQHENDSIDAPSMGT